MRTRALVGKAYELELPCHKLQKGSCLSERVMIHVKLTSDIPPNRAGDSTGEGRGTGETKKASPQFYE